MRSLAVFIILILCVSVGQAQDEAATAQAKAPAEGPQFVAELRVSLPSGDSTAGTAFEVVEDLGALASLDSYDVSLSTAKQVQPRASIRARFHFESLEDVLEWHESGPVQALLSSLKRASDKTVELRVHGTLLIE